MPVKKEQQVPVFGLTQIEASSQQLDPHTLPGEQQPTF
jgi:hypothetical protein